jgi:hypothetical protein
MSVKEPFVAVVRSPAFRRSSDNIAFLCLHSFNLEPGTAETSGGPAARFNAAVAPAIASSLRRLL